MKIICAWMCLLSLGTPLLGDEVLLGSLLKARYAMVVGDYDRAMDLAKGAIEAAPLSADAAYLQCEVMLGLIKGRGIPSPEFEQDLLEKLHAGVKNFPRDYRFYMTLGRVLTAHYRWKRFPRFEDPAIFLRQAIRLLERESDLVDSDLVETYYKLGLWYFSRDQPFLAAKYLSAVCRMDATMSWAFYYAGQACEKSGQYYSALKFLENYKAMGLRDMDAAKRPLHLTTAMLRALLNPDDTQLEALYAAIAEEGSRPGTYADIALRFYRLEDLETSLKILSHVEDNQKNAPTLNLELRIQMELHRYQKVIQQVLRSLPKEKNPRKRQILVEYGAEAALLARDGNLLKGFARDFSDVAGASFRLTIFTAFHEVLEEGKTQAWDQFLESRANPDYVDFLKKEAAEKGVRITVLEQVTQFYQARRDWDGALKRLTDEPDASQAKFHLWDDLADGYALAKKWDQAYQWYAQILEQEPDRADILNNYGYFLTVRGENLDLAKAMIIKAVGQEPDSSAYLDSRAWVHYKTGDLLKAESDLLLALELEPNDPEKLDHFGDVQLALGNRERAREAWSKALVLLQDETYYLGRDRIFSMIQKLDSPAKATAGVAR